MARCISAAVFIAETSLWQVAELRQNIGADQRQLIQWGDEKMALACIAVDLVDLHMQLLDKDLAALQAELEVWPLRSPPLSLDVQSMSLLYASDPGD